MIKPLIISISALALNACAVNFNTESPPVSKLTPNSISMPAAKLDRNQAVTRLAFGSCLKEKDDQNIWNVIAAQDPDLFVFLGDNVYGDVYTDDPRFTDPDMPYMEQSYRKLADSRTFANFRAETPMLVTWDDHDYGVNDGGADYPFREKAEQLYLDAWDIPADDIRRSRPGVYTSETLGPDGQKVQIILLDTRYFRGPLKKTDERNAPGKERYLPSEDASSTMLGEVQWSWLAEELEKPADLRIIVTSIQVIADGHGWEAWRTLPHERQKLYDTIKAAGVNNAVLVSGDRHSGAFYKRDDVVGYPLYEMTTSSLNAPSSIWRARSGETRVEDGPHRLTTMQFEVNYGLMDIDWDAKELTMRIVSPGNETWTQKISF